MVERGLVEEARSLVLYRDMIALKTIGYTELFDHFDGNTSLDEAIELIKRNSRRYARRQITWFHRNNEYTECEPVAEIILSKITERIK